MTLRRFKEAGVRSDFTKIDEVSVKKKRGADF